MKLEYQSHSNSPGIYKIINTHSNRIYIGQAKEFKKRWYDHKQSLLKNKHKNKFIQADFNKCKEELGHDDFLEFHVLEVMESSTKEERVLAEQKYIDLYFDKGNQCYNLMNKAACSRQDSPSKNPEITRLKHVEASKKMWADPDYAAHQSLIQSQRSKELWKDSEYRAKHEERIREVCQTEEHRQKLSNALKAKFQNPEFQRKHETIYQSEEFKNKIGEISKANWQNEEYKSKQAAARLKVKEKRTREAEIIAKILKSTASPNS